MLYRIRAYPSRAAGESGRTSAVSTSSTGSYATAQSVAQESSQYYGAAVLENTETGNREWWVAGSVQASRLGAAKIA